MNVDRMARRGQRHKLAATVAALVLSLPLGALAATWPAQGALESTDAPPPPAANPREPLTLASDSVVVESAGQPTTLDPAVAYDDASGGVVQAVYETLLTYNGGSTNELVPLLATSVPTIANGGLSNGNLTYTFHLRPGVTFHSGNPMGADDVVYSLQRVLVIDDPGGPAWMLLQVLNASGIQKVDNSTVRITLMRPYGAFDAILAYTVGSIVSKQTVEAHGGTVALKPNPWMSTHEDGTGPFVLANWTSGVGVTLDRYAGYWNPAGRAGVGRAELRDVSNYSTAKGDLEAGSADIISVPYGEHSSIASLAASPGSNLSVSSGAPTWDVFAGAFNERIDTANRSSLGALPSPDNVPADFFADAQMRRAFSLAFDYGDYIQNVTGNGSARLHGIFPQGMYGYDASLVMPSFDLAAARAAYNASRWATDAAYNPAGPAGGFNLTVAFNVGNTNRNRAALILQRGVEQLGPNIHLNVVGFAWSVYLGLTSQTASGMPGPVGVFFLGWGPDYADPDDYAYPFLHTGGTYPKYDGLSNASLDTLIDEASAAPNGPARIALYDEIQASAVSNCDYLFVTEAGDFHVQNRSLAGWYFNPMLSGADLGGNLASLHWSPKVDLSPPSVSAGGSLTAVGGTQVWLNGSATDNDPLFPGNGLLFWTFPYNGSVVNLTGPDAAFVFWVPGVYDATFTAVDASGNSASASVEVTVVAPDTTPPTVNAGADITLAAGANWTFVGFASDDDPTFETSGASGWRFAYNGTDFAFPGVSFAFTFWVPGAYTLTFWARDGWRNEAAGTRIATVVPPDTTPPTVDAGMGAAVDAGETVAFAGSATDNDPAFPAGAAFWWTFTYGGGEVNLTGPAASFRFTLEGNYTVTFHARDAWGNEGTSDTMVVVRPPDTQPPTVAPVADITVEVGGYAVFRAAASDNDPRFPAQGNFTWSFPYGGEAVRLFGASTGFTFGMPGDFLVLLVVRDRSGNAAGPVTFVVHAILPDVTAPAVDAGPDIVALEGVIVNFAGSATDGGRPVANDSAYTWTLGYNGTLVILRGAAPNFTFHIPGTYRVTLSVADPSGNVGIGGMNVTVLARPAAPPGPPGGASTIAAAAAAACAGGFALLWVRRARRRRP